MTINEVTGIVVGQFGDTLTFIIVDSDGNVVDLSAYTSTKTAYLRSPFTLKTLSYAVSFTTNGSDGSVYFTPAAGEIDRAGTWQLQFKFTSASASRLTTIASVEVEEALA